MPAIIRIEEHGERPAKVSNTNLFASPYVQIERSMSEGMTPLQVRLLGSLEKSLVLLLSLDESFLK